MNSTEIKACPICGQQPTVTIGRRAGNGEWVALPMVRCKPCDYQKHGNSDEEAAAKWNERAGGRQPATSEMAATKHVGISDLLDCLRGMARGFEKRRTYYEKSENDPYNINTALMVAMAGCRDTIEEQIVELEKQSNEKS